MMNWEMPPEKDVVAPFRAEGNILSRGVCRIIMRHVGVNIPLHILACNFIIGFYDNSVKEKLIGKGYPKCHKIW
jgi:hypothetical protein